MTRVVKGVFGGAETSQQRHQGRVEESNRAFSKEQSEQARLDALSLSDVANENRNKGFQAALDVLGETIPQQLQAFSQGNVGAQRTTISGLEQFQNAILGNPVNMATFQPQQIAVDSSFARQQLPAFNSGTGEVVQRQLRPDIEVLYQKNLGRSPGQEGLAFYADQLASGVPIEVLDRQIAASEEGMAFRASPDYKTNEMLLQEYISNLGFFK